MVEYTGVPLAPAAAIVVGGLRRDKGMPSFPHIDVDELNALRAHILEAAWDAYEAQEAGKAKDPRLPG